MLVEVNRQTDRRTERVDSAAKPIHHLPTILTGAHVMVPHVADEISSLFVQNVSFSGIKATTVHVLKAAIFKLSAELCKNSESRHVDFHQRWRLLNDVSVRLNSGRLRLNSALSRDSGSGS